MYNLLIVEDEEIIRNTIPFIIDWNSIGFNVEDAVDNAMDALKVIEDSGVVDVVMTDIRMPVVNGLELACEIQSSYPEVKVVLLSAYDDFEYARKGIEYGIYGYLLKSDDEDDMEKFFIKLKGVLDREKLQQKASRSETAEDARLRRLRDYFIKKVIFGHASIKEICIQDEAKKHRIDFIADSYLVTMIEFDHKESLIDSLGHNRLDSLNDLLKSMLTQRVENDGKGYVTGYKNSVLIIWKFNQTTYADMVVFIEHVIFDISNQMLPYEYETGEELTITCAMGNPVKDLTKVNSSFQNALEVLVHKTYLGEGKLIAYDTVARNETNGFVPLEQAIKNIEYYSRVKDIGSINGILDELEKQFITGKTTELSRIMKFGNKALFILFDMFVDSTFIAEGETIDFDIVQKNIGKFETIEKIFGYLKDISMKVDIALNSKSKNDQIRKVVKIALDYIGRNYDKNIYLKDVADYVKLHPVHLCRLFREELKDTFKNILIRARIERSKELLKGIDYKIYEISEMVGYIKPRYFSDLFKKTVGCTPLEYREKFSYEFRMIK